jgi:fluoride exporter
LAARSAAWRGIGVDIAERWFGQNFPWGTLMVNVLGSFIIGLFAALTADGVRGPLSSETRLFVMAGLCGGYTTFSAFSLQTLVLMREGAWASAGVNIALSVALCLAAVWVGYTLAVGIR